MRDQFNRHYKMVNFSSKSEITNAPLENEAQKILGRKASSYT